MSYTPLPLTGQKHNNQQLFLDHYLSVILPGHSDRQRVRQRMITEFESPTTKINQELISWWNRDSTAFCADIKNLFKREIPVAERNRWDDWLSQQWTEHDRLTAEIVLLETELNEQVYALYDLTPGEIKIIEDVTKYEYGEV